MITDREGCLVKLKALLSSVSEKPYLFFIPPAVIRNIIPIWSKRIDCCIIPVHSTNQARKNRKVKQM